MLRQVFDIELDVLEDRCLAAAAKLFHLRNNDSMQLFAFGFGNADYADLLNPHRLGVMRFKLLGIDILAIGQNDDVFAAACNHKIPVGTQITQITRVEPSV